MNQDQTSQEAHASPRLCASVTMVLREGSVPGDGFESGLPLALEPAYRGITSSTFKRRLESLGEPTLAAVKRLAETRTSEAANKPEEPSNANPPIDPTLDSNDLRLKIDARILQSSSILVHEAFDQVFRRALAPERVQALPSIIQNAFETASSNLIVRYAGLIKEEDLSKAPPPTGSTSASPTNDKPGGLVFPGLVLDTAQTLGHGGGLGPFWLVLLCLLVAGAAVGKAVRLRSPLFSGLVNGALQFMLCGPKNGPLWHALNLLIQPLRDRENQRLAESQCRREDLGEKITQLEQKQGFALRNYQMARPELVAELLQLRQSLEPVILIENPAPSRLAETLARSADGAALALYDEAAIGGVIKATESKAAESKVTEDLQALDAGWIGRTLRSHNQIIIEPSVSCAIQCSARRQRALLDLVFSDHLLALQPAEEQPDGMVDPAILARFSRQILTLVDQRESGRQDEVSFTPGAESRLAQFKREKLQQMGSVSEDQRLLLSIAPILAGKFALDLYLFCPGSFTVKEDLVKSAIFLVEQLCAVAARDQGSPPRPTAPAADPVEPGRRRSPAAQSAREKLLKKIGEKPPVSLRDLQQSFHRWKEAGLGVALEQLLAEGVVQWNADRKLVLSQASNLPTSNGTVN